MLERIKQLLKKISYLNAKINPTVLASSFAFYLLLTIIPLVILILNLLANLELIEVEEGLNLGNNFINILIFIFNLLWSSSKLTNNLLVISDVIYYNVEYRPRLKLRIISIILTILFIFIGILMIIVGMYLGYIKTKISANYTILLNIIQFFSCYNNRNFQCKIISYSYGIIFRKVFNTSPVYFIININNSIFVKPFIFIKI